MLFLLSKSYWTSLNFRIFTRTIYWIIQICFLQHCFPSSYYCFPSCCLMKATQYIQWFSLGQDQEKIVERCLLWIQCRIMATLPVNISCKWITNDVCIAYRSPALLAQIDWDYGQLIFLFSTFIFLCFHPAIVRTRSHQWDWNLRDSKYNDWFPSLTFKFCALMVKTLINFLFFKQDVLRRITPSKWLY